MVLVVTIYSLDSRPKPEIKKLVLQRIYLILFDFFRYHIFNILCLAFMAFRFGAQFESEILVDKLYLQVDLLALIHAFELIV